MYTKVREVEDSSNSRKHEPQALPSVDTRALRPDRRVESEENPVAHQLFSVRLRRVIG